MSRPLETGFERGLENTAPGVDQGGKGLELPVPVGSTSSYEDAYSWMIGNVHGDRLILPTIVLRFINVERCDGVC